MATAFTPYRDPRTAYGRPIPVGEATELPGMPPEQPQRAPAKAPAGGIDAPPKVSRGAAMAAGARNLSIAALPVAGAAALRATADNGTGGVAPQTVTKPGEIPAALGVADLKTSPPVRPPFFAQSETGRNVANALMAIPGGTGIAAGIAALPRVAANLPTAASRVVAAAPAATEAVRGTVLADGAMGNITPGGAAAATASPRPDAGAGRGFVNPPRVDPTQPPPTNAPPVMSSIGPGVSIVGGLSPEEMQAMAGRMRDINAATAQTQRGIDAYGPGPNGGGAGGFGGATLSSANRAQFDSTPSLSNLPAAGQSVRQFQDLKAAEREGIRNRALAARGQDMLLAGQQAGNADRLDIAQLQANTQRDVAKIGASSRTTAAETQANARAAAAEAGARKFTVVPGGQEVQEIGGMPTTIKRPDRVFNNATGTFVEQPGQQSGPTATPRAEYDKMPKGARYVGPDGKTYVKG